MKAGGNGWYNLWSSDQGLPSFFDKMYLMRPNTKSQVKPQHLKTYKYNDIHSIIINHVLSDICNNNSREYGTS